MWVLGLWATVATWVLGLWATVATWVAGLCVAMYKQGRGGGGRPCPFTTARHHRWLAATPARAHTPNTPSPQLQWEISGATVAGEGEVKILSRLARPVVNVSPNDTHGEGPSTSVATAQLWR